MLSEENEGRVVQEGYRSEGDGVGWGILCLAVGVRRGGSAFPAAADTAIRGLWLMRMDGIG